VFQMLNLKKKMMGSSKGKQARFVTHLTVTQSAKGKRKHDADSSWIQ
jgi:hypothetical protein